MTIPDKPLVVNVEVKKLTVGEICLFDPKGFNMPDLRKFFIRRTNWTQEEVDEITMEELEQVVTQLGEKLNQAAVPLESSIS